MNISVFGGSQPKENDPAYHEAYLLGRLLAQAGYSVLTGGYIGTMEAVSKGAYEAGGHVIGVTCEEIERWRTVKPNSWIKEERRFATLNERLNALIQGCDAAMALPGGPGTLTEISLTWNLMIVNALNPKPLILIGIEWETVIKQFYSSFSKYIPESQRELLQFVADVKSAVRMVKSI